MTDDQIKSMLADVAFAEELLDNMPSATMRDCMCHIKALACYVEELQAKIALLSTPEDTSVLGGRTEFEPKERAERRLDPIGDDGDCSAGVPTEMSDIVNRLRGYAACHDGDVDEAANEIERLRAEVGCFEGMKTGFSIRVSDFETEIYRLRSHVSSLAAELKRHRQGWINAMEVGLISGEYTKDAKAMLSSSTIALAKVGQL